MVVAYLEGFQDGEGRTLVDMVRAHPTPKPFVVIKPGETESGRRAALSHTGSLAGRHRVVEAALRQAGILQVRDSEDAWDAAMALALLPPLSPGNVVVISDGGGHATIVCDAADRAGLAVPELSDATRARLGGILPPRSAIVNPVDFAGLAEEEPEVVPKVLEACLADPDVGGAILAGHFGGYFKISTEELGRRELAAAREVIDVAKTAGKPVILHTIYGGEPLPAIDEFRRAGIPVYRSLEASARAMASLWRHQRSRERPQDAPPARGIDAGAGLALSSPAPSAASSSSPTRATCSPSMPCPMPAHRVASTPEESAAAARALGGALAMKLVSAGVVHKTELGGVLLDVEGPDAAANARHAELLRRAAAVTKGPARVLLTPMIRGGVETVVGAFRDPQFGPVIMFGLGGVHVEALDDVVFRLAPIGPP